MCRQSATVSVMVFPGTWERFLNPAKPEDGYIFEMDMSSSIFPFRDRAQSLAVQKICLLARCNDTAACEYEVVVSPPLPPDESNKMRPLTTPPNEYGRMHFIAKDVSAANTTITSSPTKWQLRMNKVGSAKTEPNQLADVKDLMMVLGYAWKNS